MSEQAKRLLNMFLPNGKTVAQYEALEIENSRLKQQVDALQRQVEMLIRRNTQLDPDLQIPTKH